MHRIDVSEWCFKTDELLVPLYQEVADTIIEDIQQRFERRVIADRLIDEKTGLPYLEFDLFGDDGIPLQVAVIDEDLDFVDEAIEWLETSLKTLRAKRAEKEKLAEASRL